MALPADRFEQSTLPRTACPHDAYHLASTGRERHAVEGNVTGLKTKGEITNFEVPNYVSFLFDNSFGEIAPQNLPGIDADDIAVDQTGRISDDGFSNHDRAVCLQDLQRPDSPLVVARYFEEHFSARSGAEQNIVLLKQGGIVRNEIHRFRSLQLEATPHRPSPAPKINQRKFQRVLKYDPVLQAAGDDRPGLKANPVEGGCHVLEGFDLNVQAELDFQTAIARSGFLELYLIIRCHRNEDLR